jgi:hypothetical protein
MARAVVQGSMQEYISNIEFSLNFEDTKHSVKVHIGEIVWYDGMIAKYKKTSGEEVSGRTSSLSSAIASNWLTLNIGGAQPGPISIKVDKIREGVSVNTIEDKMSDHVPEQTPKFDKLRGGSFDKFLETDSGIKVIREKDRIVKKLDIAGDQVSVKAVETTTVSSSTAVPNTQKPHATKIIMSDQYGADSSTPIKNKTASTETKKANAFTVDDTTPKLVEDSTLKEINRVTKSVIQQTESQEAVIVKRMPKVKMQVDNVEGITLKNEVGSSNKEVDFSVKTSSGNAPVDYSVKTASGSTPITDLSDIKDSPPETSASEKKKEANSKYLKMFPEDWAKMHWVKKEQFIKSQTDKEFIKFILTVEPVKAVQNACRKRLVELEKLAMQK